jgi:hypothetical protein
MPQVTIYLPADHLAAAKAAAARAQVSVSQWFGQFAANEVPQTPDDRRAFWARIDALRGSDDADGLDVLLDPKQRYADFGRDRPLELIDDGRADT